tara:strand:+ start:596 stop:1498 length:903 start_codon:yes stop_codon:yes gene_type:complete
MNSYLNKKVYFLILFLLILFVSNNDLIKLKISRMIMSHELSIMPNLIVKKLSNKSNVDFEKDKMNAASIFTQYVYDHVKPIEINLDDGASWKLLHGSIWCDGVSDILNRLLEVIDTRAYLVWLHDNKMNTPHAISMIDFSDQKLINGKNSSLDQKTLYMFDAQNNYLPKNKNEVFVNIRYMINNPTEFSDMIKLDSDGVKLNLLINEAQLWDRNIFGIENSFLRNFSKKTIKYLPIFVFEYSLRFAIYVNPILKDDYKEFLLARLEFVLMNYESASIKFKSIPEKSIYFEESNLWLKSIK